jgi:hypothetical protein
MAEYVPPRRGGSVAWPGLVLGELATRGKASAAETTLPWAALNTFRDGWAVRCEFFLDWDEGLRALAADPAEVPDPA